MEKTLTVPHDAAISRQGKYPRKMKICPHKKLYTNAQSSIIQNSQKSKPQNPLTDEWIKYPFNSYSAIKRNQMCIHATT